MRIEFESQSRRRSRAVTLGKMSRRLAPLVALVLAASLAACGGDNGDEQGGAGANLRSFTVQLDFIPGGSHSPFYWALDKGMYREAGLDVTFLPGKGSQMAATQLDQGKADIAELDAATGILFADKGGDIVSVGAWLGKYAYGSFVPVESGITSIAELEGRTIVMDTGSSTQALYPALFKLAGLDFENDVDKIVIATGSQVAAYAQGEGDVVSTFIPWGKPQVDTKRPSNVINWADAGLNIPANTFWIQRSSLEDEEKMRDVRAFLEVTYEAMKESRKDASAQVDSLLKLNPELRNRDAQLDELGIVPDYYCNQEQGDNPLGYQLEESWEQGIETLKEYSNLSAGAMPTDYYTNELFQGSDPVSTGSCDE